MLIVTQLNLDQFSANLYLQWMTHVVLSLKQQETTLYYNRNNKIVVDPGGWDLSPVSKDIFFFKLFDFVDNKSNCGSIFKCILYPTLNKCPFTFISGVQIGSILLRRHYMITLEIPCRDKSYHWVLNWITVRGAKKTQHLSVETSFEKFDTGYVKTKYDFIPSIGTHLFR